MKWRAATWARASYCVPSGVRADLLSRVGGSLEAELRSHGILMMPLIMVGRLAQLLNDRIAPPRAPPPRRDAGAFVTALQARCSLHLSSSALLVASSVRETRTVHEARTMLRSAQHASHLATVAGAAVGSLFAYEARTRRVDLHLLKQGRETLSWLNSRRCIGSLSARKSCSSATMLAAPVISIFELWQPYWTCLRSESAYWFQVARSNLPVATSRRGQGGRPRILMLSRGLGRR